jgi:predicted small lipoprotein YifL
MNRRRVVLQPDLAMPKLRVVFFPLPLLAAIALGACGNKGDLVRRTPSTLPPPATTPDSTQPSSSSPSPDAASTPAPDAHGH